MTPPSRAPCGALAGAATLRGEALVPLTARHSDRGATGDRLLQSGAGVNRPARPAGGDEMAHVYKIEVKQAWASCITLQDGTDVEVAAGIQSKPIADEIARIAQRAYEMGLEHGAHPMETFND